MSLFGPPSYSNEGNPFVGTIIGDEIDETAVTIAARPWPARPPAHTRMMVREREILRVAVSLACDTDDKTAELARSVVLDWIVEQAGGSFPPEALRHESFEHLAGGRNSVGIRFQRDGYDLWSIRADRPDKTVAGRVWTTELSLVHAKGQKPLFGLRLLVNSPEPVLNIVPAVPSVVRTLAQRFGLSRHGEILQDDYFIIESAAEAGDLIDLLVSPKRDLPVFVLSVPNISDDPFDPLIDAGALAKATTGIAHVRVVPAAHAWALTDRFGKRLSAFGGAVRVYLPGFTEEADPYYGGHELILPDRLYNAGVAQDVLDKLCRLAAAESVRRLRIDEDVLSFAALKMKTFEVRQERLKDEDADLQQQLKAARDQIDALKAELIKAQEEAQWLLEESAQAESAARAAEAQARAASYRVQQLIAQVKARGDSPDTNIPMPESWEVFAEWCEQNLDGRLRLAPRARREVKAPMFRDIAVAARCLLWLANDYREARMTGSGIELRGAIFEGVINDRCGSDRFDFDWQGAHVTVDWHLKNGGNTRDPGRCLRIYYFWDEPSQQVIVASMPAHRVTGAS